LDTLLTCGITRNLFTFNVKSGWECDAEDFAQKAYLSARQELTNTHTHTERNPQTRIFSRE